MDVICCGVSCHTRGDVSDVDQEKSQGCFPNVEVLWRYNLCLTLMINNCSGNMFFQVEADQGGTPIFNEPEFTGLSDYNNCTQYGMGRIKSLILTRF